LRNLSLSINASLAAVRAVLRLALERDKIQKGPNVSEYMLEEHSREFVLAGALRDEFVGGLPEPCKTVAEFLMNTGLRISECCGLTWDRVLLDERRDRMFIYVLRGKSKKAKRYILLTPDARAIIEKQRTISRSNYVFIRVGAKVDKELWYTAPLSRHTVSHQFMHRRKAMGLPDDAVLHSTRHTFLTDFGATGVDAYTLKAIAGHASVTTSEKYIHPVSDTMVSAMERFAESRKRQKQAAKPRLELAGARVSKNPSKVPTNSTTVELSGSAVGSKLLIQ
jgi:integrase